MAAIVRARNELVRVAFELDPPQTIGRPRRMSTLETIQLIMYMWPPASRNERDESIDQNFKICGESIPV
jgi:hypothetical protein